MSGVVNVGGGECRGGECRTIVLFVRKHMMCNTSILFLTHGCKNNIAKGNFF